MKTACVGLNPEACENKASDGIQRLVVQGGLQMGDGGPVLRGTAFGRIRLEDGNGESLLVADVNTGGVLVGQDDFDLPDKPGVRVTGKAVVGTHQDSDMWAATDGFELYSPGSSKAYAMIHRIVHKEDATITGVRVSPVVAVASPERSLHVTPMGVVVGDATAAFIKANTAEGTGANVLVYGNALVDPNASPSDFPTCTTVPVDLADLYSHTTVAWRALHVKVESCAKAGGLANATVLLSGTDFLTCQGTLIYFNDGTSAELGQCTGKGNIYYCKAEVVVS